jgi:hypothetical protein
VSDDRFAIGLFCQTKFGLDFEQLLSRANLGNKSREAVSQGEVLIEKETLCDRVSLKSL